MDVLASILSSTVGRLLLCGGTIRSQPNLIALEVVLRDLTDLRNNVMQALKAAEIDGKLSTTQVKEWLREVKEIELHVNSLQAGNTTNKCGCFPARRNVSVTQMLKEVKGLLEAGSFDMVTVEHLKDQTTASKTLAKIMNLLSDDGVRRIGIWGMGGVGKTTLVKNLNNKLNSTSLTQPFGMVIWATVSKQLDLKRVQTQIAERLGLRVTLEESLEGLAARLYQRLVKEEKFLLILDDVWETIDLDFLGVPQPKIHGGSKIILTSRSLALCVAMETDVEVKVDVLNDEEAWELFIDNAGKETSLEPIKPFAEAIARECNGLPLAIITMGRAMRGKAKFELKDSLDELRQLEPSIGGIENTVFKPLRWIYDSLQDENTKHCFLYCSLFPEDFSIEVSGLVQCWMAEGLIDEQQNYEDSLNRGIAIVENFKDSCLLQDGIEEGTVKMHDVVRDFAIFIASSLEDGCKSLVQSGIGLSQISEVELLKSCNRISFMNNKITTLPDCVIQCPKTSTLLLQGNRLLQRVPESFMVGFQALKVLDISAATIQSLPLSLTQLGELRALFLRDCFLLEELPPLGGLRKLQVLDLCGTRIRELPKGMEEFSSLRRLNLSRTHDLETIQSGVVSRLFGLEVLDMSLSAYKWGVKGEVEEGQTMFEELGCLARLTVLHIWLGSMPYLNSEDLIWIERLRRFKIIVGPYAVQDLFLSKYDERKVILSNLDLSEKWIGWLLINASNLVLTSCTEFGWMFEYFVPNSGGFFAGLKSLTIDHCHSFVPFRGYAARHDLLPNLEELYLIGNNNLECVWPIVRFYRLRKIEVSRCPKLTYLIPLDLIPNLINLEEIIVSSCNNLNELFQYSSGQIVAPDPVVPKLRMLVLTDLPELRTICREKESWQSIEQLEVIDCDLLRRLPLTSQNANTIKEIRGKQQWWSELEWDDDDDTMLNLLPYFKPVEAQATFTDPKTSELLHAVAVDMQESAYAKSPLVLMKGGLGLTAPPKEEEWVKAEVIHLMDNELSELPEKPMCPVLSALYLQRNYKLRKIPPSFFEQMHALQVLNLSKTGIKSLPESLFGLVGLKRLNLNGCDNFMMLSPKVGKLKRLEVLDLEGTEIIDLPKEVENLTNLTCLKVSFYGFINHDRKNDQSNVMIHGGVISALSQLKELSIDVNPDDERWGASVEAIANEVCRLRLLNTLKFYFPRVEILRHFIRDGPSLSDFIFIVGHHSKRVISRHPRDVELQLEQWGECLKYINGEGVPEDIQEVLRCANAFYLDRHMTVKKLSEFGIENMEQLKCCILGECNEIQVIIDGEDVHEEDYDTEIVPESWGGDKRIGLESLECLNIYHMKNLRSIWEGPVRGGCLSRLESLTLRTCPQLTTIFTPCLLDNLYSLEELTVEDCPAIKSLVSCENRAKHEASSSTPYYYLPKLKKISLHYVPELVSISSDVRIAPKLEWLSFYNCPNLKSLSIEEVSSTDLKKIEGEKDWWEAMEWRNGLPDNLKKIFVPINTDLYI